MLMKKRKRDIYMKALTDKGVIRSVNEDSVITVEHHKDNTIKLLAVADGIGGGRFGKVASSKCINDLEKWFQSRTLEEFKSMSHLGKKLNCLLGDINEEIFSFTAKTDDYCGTTLTCAIVGMNDTLIVSIGDSRCYLIKDDTFMQVTNDDSHVWYWYQSGIMTKEEARLSIYNRAITKAIGLTDSTDIYTEMLIKENDSYDKLLLFTDGVTDCLSDYKIKLISNTTRVHKILDSIIYEAVNIEQPYYVVGNDFRRPIPGKDNASGVILVK